MNRKVWLVLASALLLTACGSNRPPPLPPIQKLQFVRCDVPASLLTCDRAPEKPPFPKDQIPDDAAGRFLVDLETAGQDCRDKLAGVAATLSACEGMK